MSDHLSDVFRANVDDARAWFGWSRTDLADRLGCSTDTVCKTLNNPRGIGVTLCTVTRYAEAMGLDPVDLLTPGLVEELRSRRLERVS